MRVRLTHQCFVNAGAQAGAPGDGHVCRVAALGMAYPAQPTPTPSPSRALAPLLAYFLPSHLLLPLRLPKSREGPSTPQAIVYVLDEDQPPSNLSQAWEGRSEDNTMT